MTTSNLSLSLNDLQILCKERLQQTLQQCLSAVPARELKDAMNNALANPGKQLRPLLVYATGHVFHAPMENLDIAACAVELMHTYSLIHDDLPCMDNADLRRGKPTLHKIYNESIAVLAGDALQTLSLQLLSEAAPGLKPDKRLAMVNILARASGPFGMAAGQTLDMTMMHDQSLPLDLLLDIYRLKTGSLFSACIELGLLASNTDDMIHQRAMKEFGDYIGLAFQIQDDLLDIVATSHETGKPQGLDVKNNKITYPTLVGVKQAKEKVQSLYQQSLEAINYLGDQAQLLRDVTRQILQQE